MHGDHSTRYFRMVEDSGFKNGMKLPRVSGNSLCGFPYEENAQLKECHCGTSVKLVHFRYCFAFEKKLAS